MNQTTALRKISALRKRIWGIQGGQGAGKTIAILIILINFCFRNKDKTVLIVSEELSKMRRTVIKDFIKVMRSFGVYEDTDFKANTLYRFPNGTTLEFIGLDKSDIGKGLRSDVVYFNEANKCDFEAYHQIASRSKRVIIDFNPDKFFWFHDDVQDRADCDFLKLTFEDNEYLDINERNEILLYKEKAFDEEGNIKSKYWHNKWKVYGKGEVGALQGVILENWEEIDDIPKGAKLVDFGMDFGYANSYTAVVGVWEYEGRYILDEVFYKRGHYPSQVYPKIKDEVKNDNIWADHARPGSIDELNDLGLYVKGAEKPQDALTMFLDEMNKDLFYVTKRSKNIKEELNTWVWAVDRNGKSLNVPIKENDHAMDATKYCIISRNRYSGEY